MTRNPFLNALAALIYIVFVATIMTLAQRFMKGPDTMFTPVAVLSLFTLSAAVMGYIFLYQPAQLYLDGKKKVALDLFLKTVAVFAGITIIIFILLFTGILK